MSSVDTPCCISYSKSEEETIPNDLSGGLRTDLQNAAMPLSLQAHDYRSISAVVREFRLSRSERKVEN